MNNIEKTLTDWGRAKQILPQNHQVMKSEILGKLSPNVKPDDIAQPLNCHGCL